MSFVDYLVGSFFFAGFSLAGRILSFLIFEGGFSASGEVGQVEGLIS